AECFKDFGAEPHLYLLKKFLPFSYSAPLMIGNIANFFLDELMNDSEATFKDTFPKVFQLNPLAFTIFEDRDLRDIMSKAKKHFLNLKMMVQKGFAESEVQVEDCFLEPSFYTNNYGLQGRLDVFYLDPIDPLKSAIVELKSGKTYKPNKWGINQNHYVQTLLYDLMVKSVFNNKLTPTNFILYSGADNNLLRFAPVTKTQQFEAIQVRNQIVGLEQAMANGDHSIFQRLRPDLLPGQKGFIGRDLSLFEKVYQGMRGLERKYFHAFAAFIAREHMLAKTGVQGLENVNGLASLWLNDFEEKTDSFDILSNLKIEKLDIQEDPPEIVFQKTEKTHPLANFRKGDITILYPFNRVKDTVLTNQIFKGSITEVTDTQVTVRLRYKQSNTRIFEEALCWNLEHDLMDSSFTGMYRGLFSFLQFPEEKKDLLLTLAPPKQAEVEELVYPKELTEEQKGIYQKMLAAADYFLLWGPPGTGKTSVMLRHTVSYLLNETDESILLLAYTNKAVDEICASVESIDKFARKEYIRIGSRTSTAPVYQDRLLDQLMKKVNNRKELKELLDSHRIVVATVSSMASKLDLLKVKKFSRVIIDEASQILEPAILGLLPLFERFILIGDHQQLPAVVVQDSNASKVEDSELQDIGLNNLRNSLFERLYKRCQAENWHWAFAQLSHQGRMHKDIMQFTSDTFYSKTLKVLPEGIPRYVQQTEAITWQLPESPSPMETMLSRQRVLFLPTPGNAGVSYNKTNKYEAERIAELILSFQNIYKENNKAFTKNSLGIITPYRAQIAQIKSVLQEQGIPDALVTIDTVERYQGGARDVILLSLCANHDRQLRSLISHSDEGVDRKLNVALTRAREHLVILGNVEVLRGDKVYSELIDYGRPV
ncbi:MAG: DEAD/DEAH box helicase, partial [Saprospiraceae bacterium]